MALSKIQDEMLSLSGNACKAWVNFNGTGTVAIRDSFNVSSITDNGTGDYTVNFTNAMSDANYSISGCTSNDATGSTTNINNNTDRGNQTTSAVNIKTGNDTGAIHDVLYITVHIFGN